MTLGEIIREKRKARGWTQSKLAKKIGVASGTVSYWETEGATPSIYAMWDMADVFNCSIDELCGRKENSYAEKQNRANRHYGLHSPYHV